MEIRKFTTFAILALLTAIMLCSSVRADVITPQPLLFELKETVLTADDWIFRGYTVTNTRQLKNALYNKIDAVITMVDEGEYMEAAKKLEKDIAVKLTICTTTRDRARSWLSYDLALRDIVVEFEGLCQGMIDGILIALNRLMDQPK